MTGTGTGTVTITKDTINSTVEGNGIVLLDFWAAWCGPCRSFAPVFEKAAQDNPDIVFGKVDTEAEPQLAAAFGISSIPTLVAIRDRTLVLSQPGALPAAALADLVSQVRALDMDAVAAAGRAASAPEVDVGELERARSGGAVVIDVREPDEYAAGHVAGAQLVPLSTVPQAVHRLPTDRPVYVICQSGRRSLDAAQFLLRHGIDARSVAGGTSAWAGSGRAVETGSR
jgi:thioredoxin 1